MSKINSRLWNQDYIKIVIVQFCLGMGQQMLNTLVPLLADSLGASAATIGLVSSIFSISATLVLVFVTPAFDCYSRKKMMIYSIAVMIVAFLGYGFTKSVDMLFVFRLLQGASQGCTMALGLVMVSDVLPKEELGKGIGIFTLCQAVAQAFGPGIGLAMKDSIGFSLTFFIGTSAIAAGLVACCFITDKKELTGNYKLSVDRVIAREAIHPSVLTLALQGSYCCIASFIAIYGGLRGVGEIGLYFTVYALCLLGTRPISGVLLDKIGYEAVLIFGIVFFGLSFVAVSMATDLWIFLLSAVLSALGYGVCQPTLNYICMRCVPSARRGAASSTSNIAMSLGFLVAVTGAGYLVDYLKSISGSEVQAYSAMFLVMIAPIAFALLYFLFTKDRIKKAIAAVDSIE